MRLHYNVLVTFLMFIWLLVQFHSALLQKLLVALKRASLRSENLWASLRIAIF